MDEKWLEAAKEAGFDECGELDVSTLKTMQMVRDACAQNKCGQYGANWTCPPASGTLEECDAWMHRYGHGILLQTVGKLSKDIDLEGYASAGKRHGENFQRFCAKIREEYPDALCLGAGVCSTCAKCAYPEPCRFPDRRTYAMEGFGLFVTQVCRDNNMKYYYGPRTIAYTACVLFD